MRTILLALLVAFTMQFGVAQAASFDCASTLEKNESEEAYCNPNSNLEAILVTNETSYQNDKLSFSVILIGEFAGFRFIDLASNEIPIIAVNCTNKELHYLSNDESFGNYNSSPIIDFDAYLALLSSQCSNGKIEEIDFKKFQSLCYSRIYYMSNSLINSCENITRDAYYDVLNQLFSKISTSSNYIGSALRNSMSNWVSYSDARCVLDGIMVGTPATFICSTEMAAEFYSNTIEWVIEMDQYEQELLALNISMDAANYDK